MPIKRFKDLKIGDWLKGADGNPVQITQVFEEHVPQDSFIVTAENGETITVSGNHLFYVITETDQLYHRTRLSESAKALKNLPPEVVKALEAMAETNKEHETTINEMRDLLGDSLPVRDVVDRVALAIGRIAEENYQYRVIEDNTLEEEKAYIYDGRIFAQQILALYNKKKYSYPVRMGRVINTYALSMIFEHVTLPDLNTPTL